MKYLIFGAVLLAFSSCKKSYTCSCVDPMNGHKEVASYDYKERYKSMAELNCIDREIAWDKVRGYEEVTCSIK